VRRESERRCHPKGLATVVGLRALSEERLDGRGGLRGQGEGHR